ncbi:type VII secretion target [Nocardia sp. CDC160]|uniref:type VII secretion target n=1 Tax=Nocardia sp. CDC160 TaxID=3112166 RepID=UPI002DB8E573|nr:type VII secretion target [Nocardia sp. CDC160]MEC3914613.1 type VII secretion target [Nocardia sp. CDC160]
MTDMLRADIAALRIMAAGIRTEADAIAAIDPVDLIAQVAQSMPNSATGAAATGVCAPLRTALSRMATQLTTLADTTTHAATTYEQTEADLEHQLDSYLHPTP